MVGLCVVDHDVIDVRRIHHLADLLQVLVKEFLFYRFKQGGLLAAPQQIGVVGGAIIRVHDDVEDPQIRVEGTHPPNVLCGLLCLHCNTSFLCRYFQYLSKKGGYSIVYQNSIHTDWQKCKKFYKEFV